MVYVELEIPKLQLMSIAVYAFIKYTENKENVINKKFYFKVIKLIISMGLGPIVDNMITLHRNNFPFQYNYGCKKNKDHIGKKSRLSMCVVTVLH